MSNPVTLVEPDPFIGVGTELANYIPSLRTDTAQDARSKNVDAAFSDFDFDLTEITAVSRPLNGIVAKPNTHAYVQVIRSDKTILSVFNQLGIPEDYAMSGSVPTHKEYFDEIKDANGSGGNLYGNPSDRGGLTRTSEPSSSAAGNLVNAVGKFFGARSGDYNKLGADRSPMNSAGIRADGEPVAKAWTDWILQSVRESRSEKTQLIETFGDSYLYAFGEKPRVLAIQGLLMNTVDYNWRAVFWENWERYFRASKLIELDARIYLSWEDIIVEGYPLQAQCQESATSPNAMSFSFNMYVTAYYNISMANRVNTGAMRRLHSLSMSRSSALQEDLFQANQTGYEQRFKPGDNPFNALMDVGTTITNEIYEYGVSSDGWTLDEHGNKARKMTEFELLLVRQGRELGNLGTRLMVGTHQHAMNGRTMSALNAFMLQASFDTLMTVKDEAQKSLAKLGDWMSVEQQNAWFGLIGKAGSDWFGAQRWGGNPGDDQYASALQDAALSGSFDRLVQQMAYSLASLPGLEDAPIDPARVTIGDVSAQGGYKKYGALPGAATIVPLVPVDTGASTTSLEGLAGTAEAGDPFGR